MRRITIFSIFSLLVFVCQTYATDWYVRPSGGDYGAENGTSYANAWDGPENVIWGAGGVQAGDTLYICGLHHRKYLGASLWHIVGPVASGTSNSIRVTIRGDHPGDPGIVWGSGILAHESWVNEGSNTYSITIPSSMYSGWLFEDVTASSWAVLDKEISLANCKANPGSYYSSDYKAGSKLYVHCSDNDNPTNRISFPRAGYRFGLNKQSYITFRNLKFYALYRMFLDWGNNETGTYLGWDNCIMWYGEGGIQEFRTVQTHHIVINNCDIAWAQNGLIFGPRTGGPDTDCCHDYTVSNCYIHDFGVRVTDPDAHGVGVQGGYNGLIEKNTFENCGTGPLLYANNVDQSIKNTVIRWNFVKDTHTLGSATGFGIALNCDGQNIADKSENEVYGNIVINCTVGYRITWAKYQVVFYNNVAYNCEQSFYLYHAYQNIGPNVILRNNISLNPKIRHIYFASDESPGNYTIDSDNNLFYPTAGNLFYFNDAGTVGPTTFAQWQALSRPGCVFDPSSLTSDPKFSNSSGSYSKDTDFQLHNNSPAIDAGVDVGINQDYLGTSIPLGFAPDIGAYEIIKPIYIKCNASPSSGDFPLLVTFSGDAIGDNPPFAYSWDFGDGSTSASQNPTHTFYSAGTFIVSLSVTDNKNTQETSPLTIIAFDPIKSLTISLSTGSPSSGEGGITDPSPGIHLYTRGSSVEITAIPYLNFRLSKWTGDINVSDILKKKFSLTMDRDKSISALFCVKCGDINGDLNITASDAQVAFEIFLGKISNSTFCQLENADVNCDGTSNNPKVTAADAQAIFEKFLGRSELPCQCSGNSRSEDSSTLMSSASKIRIITNVQAVNSGEDVIIPILIERAPNMKAFGFDLKFPSDSLEFIAIEETEFSNDFTQIDANEIAKGILRVGGYKNKATPPFAKDMILVLVFKAVQNLPESPPLSVINTYDDLRNPIDKKSILIKKKSDNQKILKSL